MFDRELQSDGFSSAMYLYKAPFYPELPCQNLVSMCDGPRSCGRIQHVLEKSGAYVFVISSDSSVELAAERRGRKGGQAASGTDRATGPYAFFVHSNDPAGDPCPGGGCAIAKQRGTILLGTVAPTASRIATTLCWGSLDYVGAG